MEGTPELILLEVGSFVLTGTNPAFPCDLNVALVASGVSAGDIFTCGQILYLSR